MNLRSARWAVRCVAVLAVAGLCCAAPTIAPALEMGASVRVTVADAAEGTVLVVVTAPQAAQVGVSLDGAALASAPQESGVATYGPFALSRSATVVAVGRNGSGAVVWSSETLVDPARFVPATPRVSLSSGRAVGRTVSFDISSNETITGAFVAVGDDVRMALEATRAAGGSLRMDDLALPYGPTWLTVSASNAFGRSKPARLRLYNVGTLADIPAASRLVLVDKRAMRTYHVLNRRVLRSWPIATGMPSTPTPRGLFRLGSAQSSGGGWGVLRRPLQKRSGSRWVGTSYYIHGTNEPWSIGMMASHGCVRMFNSHVRQFASTVPTGTRVRIR
ncbi:MAG: L,D-transpeptidase [Coriobacteriia bacterium]|nr:L,D-transpeptidase [Coriobacteriia bacterium]